MMATASIVDYIHELKQAGFTDRQSEVQAKKIEQVVTEIKNELATKADLDVAKRELELSFKRDIETLRYQTLKFIVWTGFGVVITLVSTLGTMLAKGFHWF